MVKKKSFNIASVLIIKCADMPGKFDVAAATKLGIVGTKRCKRKRKRIIFFKKNICF